jgi:very-short-patch-repair endonuclease
MKAKIRDGRNPKLWDKLRPLARQNRHEPTPAESKLWKWLRGRQIAGLKFRRQHAIDKFITDFVASKKG